MNPYDMIKAHLDAAVPFARTTLVSNCLRSVMEPQARSWTSARRYLTTSRSMHAGAMFTLGRGRLRCRDGRCAGSGDPADAPCCGDRWYRLQNVAKGKLTAHARTSESGAALMQTIEDRRQGRL